jgi:peptidoglycan/LPS O-acetylase OafA/YrhL
LNDNGAHNSFEHKAMDTGKRHLASLDSLRGIGVVLIFANHFGYIRFGWIGLWIFFALSGYLITDSLLKMKALPIGQYFGRFYVKRAFRILPAFIVFFSISVALYFIFWSQGDPPLSHFWIYIVTFTFNHYPQPGLAWFDHLWSLSLEEQFYVVWPWLVFFLPMSWLKRVAPCWILVAPVLRLILPWFYASRWSMVEASLLCQADAFAIGGCVAIFRDELPGPRRAKRLMWIMTAVIILIGLANYFAGASRGGPYWQTLGWPHVGLFNYQYVWGYGFINVWAAILILACLKGTAPSFLNFPPLVFLGRISYGAYLSHLPLLGVYFHYLEPIDAFSVHGFLIFVIWFANVILVSWLSFRFIEIPFLRIKNRLGKQRASAARPGLSPELPPVKPIAHD